MRTTRIYAVANQKGGVGKTTTAVNLSACLAEAGERVLLIDLDPQANATSGLGMRANGVSTHDLLDGAPLRTLAKPSNVENLDVVMAKSDLAAAAVELAQRAGGERYLADALDGAVAQYSYVLLDCPPSFGPLTVNALAAATWAIVPVQAEYYALEGLSQLLATINLVKAQLNPDLAVAGILLTMADGRTRLSAEVEAELRRHFGSLVFTTDDPPLGPPRRGAEPRCSRDRLRPALSRRGGLLEGGDGACRAFLRSDAVSGAGSRSCWARPGQPELVHLPVETIHPNPRQPRRRFEPEAAIGLASSIRLQGVFQPIVVRRRAEGGFELVAGERRWRAAREAGVATLPALVRDVEDRDSLLLGLVENVAREQLSPVEEARAYASLVDEFELSLGDVAERVGRSKSGRIEPPATARAAGGSAVDARSRRHERGSRACSPVAARRRRPKAACAPRRQGGAHCSRGRTGCARRRRPPTAATGSRCRPSPRRPGTNGCPTDHGDARARLRRRVADPLRRRQGSRGAGRGARGQSGEPPRGARGLAGPTVQFPPAGD